MASIPKGKKIEIFNLAVDGTFGRFKTRDSYEVQYLLSSLPIGDAEATLCTAAEAFPFQSISFEEMIQRDIDTKRVQKELVEDYLEGARDKVVFFPPLIVAVVSKENAKPLLVYDKVESDFEGDSNSEGIYTVTYGQDKFQTLLNTVQEDTGHYITVSKDASGATPGGLPLGLKLSYVPYAATLKLNRRHVQLVVIDGQHRFEAMKILWRTRKDLVDCMDVPVCIVYTPGAVAGSTPENIVKNLREMFVTINTTSRTVSGHFIDLLKDKSLASIAVRALATLWKGNQTDPCRSRLQMLEWNERADNKASTVNREHTITTVSIIANALRTYLFDNFKNGVPQSLLNLQAVRHQLELTPESTKYANISDEDFDVAQEPILKSHIEKMIAPALNILFTEPRPYREKWDAFIAGVSKLEEQSEVVGVQSYLKYVLGEFRTCSSKDSPQAKDAEVEFEKSFEDLSGTDKPYFLNVFQQGLLRTWIVCSQTLWDHGGLSSVDVAAALVPALNKFCFRGDRLLFDVANPYATRVLYQAGTKPNLSQWGRTAWTNVVSATLLQKASWSELKTRVIQAGGTERMVETEKALSKLRAVLEASVKALSEEVEERIRKDINDNWRIKEYPKAVKDDLERLSTSSEEDDKHSFRVQIDDMTSSAFKEANAKFEAQFGFALG